MKLTINENEYPLQWGMGCLEMFCDALSCDIADIDKALSPGPEQITYLSTLILCAVKNGADKESYYEEFEVSRRQLQNALDNAPEGTMLTVMEDFKRSKYFGKTMAEYLSLAIPETDGDVEKKSSPSENS